MKLTSPELNLLSQIAAHQTARKRNAWSNHVSVLVVWAVFYFFGQVSDFLLGMLATLATVTLVYALRTQFEVGAEYRIVELLRRYVNRDPEVIEDLSEREKSTDEGAAA